MCNKLHTENLFFKFQDRERLKYLFDQIKLASDNLFHYITTEYNSDKSYDTIYRIQILNLGHDFSGNSYHLQLLLLVLNIGDLS